jgi:WD40 repeat protein
VLLANLKEHTEIVRSAAFSADGNRVLTVADDGKAILWNASKGQVIQSFKRKSASASAACFSKDGRLVMTAFSDSTIVLWNGINGKLIKTMRGKYDNISSAKLSDDGKQVISTGATDIIVIWDIATGSQGYLTGHTDLVKEASYNPDANWALSIADDSTARLWNADVKKVKVIRGKGVC